MKIKLLRPYKIGLKTHKKGTQIIVLKPLGKKLIRNKFAIAKDFISLQEIEADKISVSTAQEIIEDLPANAIKRIKRIPEISNKIVLEFLLGDSRVTVRKSALKRLEDLK